MALETTETPPVESAPDAAGAPGSSETSVPETPASPDPTPPKSFREAITRELALEDASTEGEPATTAQETPEVTPEVPTSKPARKAGPIPFEVHEKALANAREKTRAEVTPEVETTLRKEYAWADPIQTEDRQELTALYQGLKTDLIGTLTTLIERASQHPDHAEALKAQATRLMHAAQRVQGEPVPEDVEPEPDIPLEDGRAVYSAEQQRRRDGWLMRQVSAQFDQKLQPFQQDRDRLAHDQRMRAAYAGASALLETYKTKAHFMEHKDDILALMKKDPALTLDGAYNEVLLTKVLPTASHDGRAAALADIHHKATAGSLNPQSTTTTQPRTSTGRFTPAIVEAHFADAER
jgi:hypothetical protein